MEREDFPLEIAPDIVREFVSILQSHTEAPDAFLAIVPIFVGSVLAGRWIEFNGQPLNNYYLIVGQTGTAKKTTAQGLAMRLLREVKALNPRQQYQPTLIPGEKAGPLGPDTAYPLVTHFSVEGLQAGAIGDGTSTAIQIGEYGSVFEVSKRQGQGNTISELTNMYDGNLISVKTVSRKSQAQGYAISIFGASTKSWLSDFSSGKNISGGFVNRHLVIAGEPIRILPNPQFPPQVIWDQMVSRFSELIPSDIALLIAENSIKWTGTKRTITWSSEAKILWDLYYRKQTQAARKITTPFLIEVSARELTHAIKLMGLSAFLDGRTTVLQKDLEFGTRCARWSTQNVITMMSADSYDQSEPAQRVLNKLSKSGPMNKTDLARALGGRQTEINKAIWHLVIDEVLEDCPDGLLRINGRVSNSQQTEIDQYFGKSDTSALMARKELEVDSSSPMMTPF